MSVKKPRYLKWNIMKITIEIDTEEDEEVLELIKRLVVLLEKEDD